MEDPSGSQVVQSHVVLISQLCCCQKGSLAVDIFSVGTVTVYFFWYSRSSIGARYVYVPAHANARI